MRAGSTTLVALVAATAVITHSQAQTLYSNGPINGQVDAWTINSGFQVADTFTLGSSSTVTGLDFGVWADAGDTMSTIDWSVVAAVGTGAQTTLGATLFSGVASVSTSPLFTNGLGYAVSLDTISLGSLALASGTYWIELQNASSTNGDPIYWDINGGTSYVWESEMGYNPNLGDFPDGSESDAFDILGSQAAIPEPASLAALFMGLGMVVCARRRRTF